MVGNREVVSVERGQRFDEKEEKAKGKERVKW